MKEAMSNVWGFFVFWAVLTATLVPGCESNCSFPAIFNFGDSNTDTGGFFAAFPTLGPPYGMTYFKKPVGRATDGRVIVDFLAQGLGLAFLSPYLKSIGSDYKHGANFATVASTVGLPHSSPFDTGVSPFSLAIQCNQFKQFKVIVDEQHHSYDNGLKYGTKACCGYGGGDYNFNKEVFCGNTKVLYGQKVTAEACNDPYNYVSWDGIHATDAANKLTAQAIFNGSHFDPPFSLHQSSK